MAVRRTVRGLKDELATVIDRLSPGPNGRTPEGSTGFPSAILSRHSTDEPSAVAEGSSETINS